MTSTNPDDIRQKARMEWDVASVGWKKWEREILGGLQPVSHQLMRLVGITAGYSVLDVATGTGEPALTVAKIVGPEGSVTGVDLSPEMLEIAKERAAYQGLKNVTFQPVDDENLSSFQDAMFDSVVCRFGLMLMPDPTKTLGSFLRVLKPNGKAAVSVWGRPEKMPVMAAAMKTIAKHVPDFKPPPPGSPGFFAIPSVDILRSHFMNAGFRDFESEVDESFVAGQTKTAEESWEMMSEIAGSLTLLRTQLSEEKNRAIKNEMIEIIRSMYPSGPAKVTGELIIGVGRKP